MQPERTERTTESFAGLHVANTVSLSQRNISLVSADEASAISVSLCCPPVVRSLYCRLMKTSLQLVGAAVQLDLEGLEVRPVVRLGAPTLQHDLVEEVGTFGRSWHPVTVGNLVEHFLVAES